MKNPFYYDAPDWPPDPLRKSAQECATLHHMLDQAGVPPGKEMDRIKALIAQRDELIAENERLRAK